MILYSQIILAIYYTIADVVLLLQYFYYEGFTLKDKVKKAGDEAEEVNGNGHQNGDHHTRDERTPLLAPNGTNGRHLSPARAVSPNSPVRISDQQRRGSQGSFRERYLSVDGTHLSPVTPLVRPDIKPPQQNGVAKAKPTSILRTIILNFFIILTVVAAGVLGWYLSPKAQEEDPDSRTPPSFNVLGQVFGYLCAALYLGSRIPQLLLNYRRKSTEGISMLFFLFACIGNLTYVLSIVAYEPKCKHKHCREGEAVQIYGRYFLVNLSWLLGSFGTLLLDGGVFIQYFLYKKPEDDNEQAVV